MGGRAGGWVGAFVGAFVLTGHGGLDFVAAVLVAGVGVEELAVGLVEKTHIVVHTSRKQAVAVMRKAHARDGVQETV